MFRFFTHITRNKIFIQRISKPKSRTDSRIRLYPYSSAHLLDQTFTDRKTESRPMNKIIKFYKTIKNSTEFIRFDSNSRITDIKFQFFIMHPIAHTYKPFFGKFDRIIHKVSNNLIYTIFISGNYRIDRRFFKKKMHIRRNFHLQ